MVRGLPTCPWCEACRGEQREGGRGAAVTGLTCRGGIGGSSERPHAVPSLPRGRGTRLGQGNDNNLHSVSLHLFCSTRPVFVD